VSSSELTTQAADETGRAARPAPGQRLRLPVTDMALEGDAIARHHTYVLFVAGAIPGEEVEVEVESAGRKHGRARLLSVVRPSPHRVAAPCPYFGPCGGCAWQHIAYPEQLRLKERLLGSTLELALGARVQVAPAAGLDHPWGFRNKAHFVVGRGADGQTVLGHYAARSKDLVAVEECRVHSEPANRVAFRLRDLLREHRVPPVEGDRTGTGTARHVLARAAERSGEVQAVLVAARRKFPGLEDIAREITQGPCAASGFHLNTNRRPGNLVLGSFTRKLRGRERLLEEVAGVRFLISPVSFFQTSARAAQRLVQLVLAGVGSPAPGWVLDLYAGVGLFALPLARAGHRVLAIEENPFAIGDGEETARLNRIRGCVFHRGRVESEIRAAARRRTCRAVVLDPPREGCSPSVLAQVARVLRPRVVVYVSCDPRALGADLRRLLEAGYIIEEVRPVDMFPHTAHIETVARLRLPTARSGGFEGERDGDLRRDRRAGPPGRRPDRPARFRRRTP